MNDEDVGGLRGGGKGEEKPVVISPPPRAVVVDTNLWGTGILDVVRLTVMAKRLMRSRIEVWVPRQVLWEWVSHAVQDAQVAAPAWNQLKRAGLVSGKFAGTDDVSVVLKAMEATVSGIPNVRIVPMTGDAAIEGLKDQVLGTGPGTLRSGVKTGAVDSSLVRDAVAHVGGDATKIVFLTKNQKDMYDTAKAIGVRVHVRNEKTLYPSLFPPAAEPEQLVGVIVEDLEEKSSPDTDEHPAYMLESLLPVSDIDVPRSVFDPSEHFELTDTSLAYGASVVAITDVEVVEGLVHGPAADASGPSRIDSPDHAPAESQPADGAESQAADRDGKSSSQPPAWTVAFTAVLLADVDAVGYQLDNDGQVLSSAGVIGDTVILAPMVADLADRSVQSLTASDTARAEKSNPNFADAKDALAWVLTELGGFHGVELEDGDVTRTEFTFRGPKGAEVKAARSEGEDWTLTFDLGNPNADAVISCHYDLAARAPGRRGSYLPRGRHFVVSGTDGFGPSAYWVMSDVWRHLNGL